MDFIKLVEESFANEKVASYPSFKAGDTITVTYRIKEGDKDKFNTAIDIVESRGYDVVDFNTPEMIRTLGIDWKKDFYNSKHVNYMGAEKYTRYLTAYIEDNYDLPDHRDDSRFGKWDESYEAYLQFIDNHELKYKQKKM